MPAQTSPDQTAPPTLWLTAGGGVCIDCDFTITADEL